LENMPQIAGLVVFVSFTALTVYLNVKRKISDLMAAALLAFTLLSSLAVANIHWIGLGNAPAANTGTFEKEIVQLKENALNALLAEWGARQEELAALALEINTSTENLHKERQAMESALEESRHWMESRAQWQEQMREFQDFSQASGEQMAAIHNTTAELALVLTRLIYLQTEGSRHLPLNQADSLRQQVLDGLDELVSLAIPDPFHRQAFVEEVMESAHQGQDWITGD